MLASLVGSLLFFVLLVRQIFGRCFRILRLVPGPPGYPLIGNLPEIFYKSSGDLFTKIRTFSTKYSIYRLSLGPVDIINVVNPKDIEQILTGYQHLSKSKIYSYFDSWLGTGLLTSTGEKWHHRRKLLTPAFHFMILQEFFLVFKEETDKVIQKIEEGSQEEEPIDIMPIITQFTLQTIGETAMGFKNIDESILNTYKKNVIQMGKIVINRVIRPWCDTDFIYKHTRCYEDEKKIVNSLHNFSRTVIKQRKKTFAEDASSNFVGKKKRLLDILLQAKENGADIDDDGIREEVDTFMFEGHDTTAAALSLILMLLADNPEHQEKAASEILEAVGPDKDPDYSDTQKLPYLERCIKEGLRLYPSVPMISRSAGCDYITSTGYKIPAGTTLHVHIFDLHRKPDLYPDPERFDPDRFLKENCTGRHPFAYLPFSAGPRNCIEKMLPLVKSGIWMAFFTLLLLIGRTLFQHLRNILVLRAIPSPPALPIIGLATEFMSNTQEELFRKCRGFSQQLRPIFRMSLFHVNAINFVNAADIEQVLSSYNHLQKSNTYDFLREWLGTGLLTSTGEKWHARRKLLTPTFHFKILQDFLAVFNEETKKVVEKIEETLDDSGIDITKHIDHLTLQSVGETAMGLDLVDEGILIDYRQNLRKMGKIIIDRITFFLYRFSFIYRWSQMAHEEKVVAQSLHRFSETVIRRRKVMRRGSTIERKRLAMLDLLLKYKEEGADIDDEGIREEVDTFLFEGHDTTAIALCMLIILLANNKDVQDKVVKEIEEVLGKKPRHPTHEDLPKLEYLECCIKESLRLYPSVPTIGRIAGEEFTTSTGYTIPKGTIMLMQIYDLHRDASVFPNPEKFDPDRFKPENTMKRNSFAYIPFSAGPRNCIGQKFAMWEMKAVICGLLQNFQLSPVDTPMDIKFYMDLILRTNSPVRVKFVKRQ